jgi:AcrR family transcriptional regulator
MNWKGPRHHSHFRKPGYHHGNLKEALIAAARKLIAEHGPLGFTLNEASREAGVSASAPYRHFRDRNALIEATAEEGFRLLKDRLESSIIGTEDPYEALCKMGPAYYGFALDEPGLYQAMFSSGLPQVGAPVAEAGAKAFATLQNAVKRLGTGEAESRALSLKIWAFSHGMSGLIATGAVSVMEAGELSRRAVDAFLKDAGVTIPKKSDPRHSQTT